MELVAWGAGWQGGEAVGRIECSSFILVFVTSHFSLLLAVGVAWVAV